MKRRPLMIVALSMILGITLSYYLNWQTSYLFVPALICLSVAVLCLFFSRRFFIYSLIIMVFITGAYLFAQSYASEFVDIDLSREYTIEGRVADMRADNYNIITLDNVALIDEMNNKYTLPKKAQLYTSEQLNYGDIVRYRDMITPPSSPRNPGAFDNRMYLAANGIGFSSFVYELNIIGNDDQWYFFPYKLRDYIADEIDYYFTPQTAAVAKAMLIGVKQDIPDEIKDEFSQTGISHVLAISGLHVTLLSGVLDWLLKRLSIIRGLRFSLNIGFLIFYCILTGLSASVIRASIIGVCIIIGKWKFAKRDMMTFLCAALIISLFINSVRLFMPGFLMSFGVFFGLICLSPQIELIFKNFNFVNSFSKSLSASIAASIAVFPLTAYFFGGISLIAPLANFFAVPLAMLIVFMTGIFLAFSAIPFIGSVLSVIPQASSSFLIYLNHAVSSLDIGYIKTQNFPIVLGIITYIVIFCLSDYLLINRSYKYFAAVSCCIGIITLYSYNNIYVNNYLLKAVILDVGTGDAIHIKTQNSDYLIDNGGNIQYSQINDYTENNEIIYNGIIVSNDRTKNLEKIIANGYTDKLIVPGNYEKKDYDTAINIEEYDLHENIIIDERVSLNPIVSDGKNYSFLLEIDSKPVCLLAQNSADTFDNINNIDIVKLSKGGDSESLTEEFVEMTNPDSLIISVKDNSSKDLPDTKVLEISEEFNLPVYKTSESGAVTITWNENSEPAISTMK